MTPETLRDIKGPLSLHGHLNIFLLAVILAVLAAAALLFLYLARRKKGQVSAAPVPAHQIAFERLEALKKKDLIQKGMFKEFYSQLSDIVRHYLEDRFSLRAPEMTTEEFLIYLRDSGVLLSAHKALLKDFLVSCDLVKFAKHTPSSMDAESVLASAVKLVDETKEELAPVV